jgi:hypothetical protein
LKAQPRYSTASSPIIRSSRTVGVAPSTLPLYPGPVGLVMESASSKRCRRGVHLREMPQLGGADHSFRIPGRR